MPRECPNACSRALSTLVVAAILLPGPLAATAVAGPPAVASAIEISDPWSAPDRMQRIDAVIDRARAQIGTPYAWGGGGAQGPGPGIRDGGIADEHRDYEKVGFDCSGLMVYSFASAGIRLPRYSGHMLHAGPRVPVAAAQRGDLLFWGEGGRDHVALYLGGETVLEAPFSGGHVRIAPLDRTGLLPFAVRMI
ncbi:C40 family peptidase [Hoyosella sp. G463]|uniref:C40 family peptidase n=1 Tax=Lolliginicoccus lacisalsi TaxID=2742202 RepID=A0A927JB78_9ACTN|nr:C40 family peptidase [Lolliginicoccus lacisalsi]MBD8505227.1 C40 family peptidase [Lolliginicoccus lacisalsi]